MDKVTHIESARGKKTPEVRVETKQTNIIGDCKCLACGHEWRDKQPAGVASVYCPECETFRGVFIHPVVPVDGVPRVRCNCGQQFYIVLQPGIQCISCGTRVSFEELEALRK